MIVTDDPVIFRHMAAPRSPFVRGHWFKGMKFDPRVDNILSMQDERGHKELREKLMPGVFWIAMQVIGVQLTHHSTPARKSPPSSLTSTIAL